MLVAMSSHRSYMLLLHVRLALTCSSPCPYMFVALLLHVSRLPVMLVVLLLHVSLFDLTCWSLVPLLLLLIDNALFVTGKSDKRHSQSRTWIVV